MNATEKALERGYDAGWDQIARLYRDFYGSYSEMFSTDTLQFSDYSRYASSAFDPVHKREHHKIRFPLDLERAQAFAEKLISQARKA